MMHAACLFTFIVLAVAATPTQSSFCSKAMLGQQRCCDNNLVSQDHCLSFKMLTAVRKSAYRGTVLNTNGRSKKRVIRGLVPALSTVFVDVLDSTLILSPWVCHEAISQVTSSRARFCNVGLA